MKESTRIEVRIVGKGKRFIEYEEGMTVKEVLDKIQLPSDVNVLKSDGSVALEDIELEEAEKIVVMGKDGPWGSRIFINEDEDKLVVTPVVSGG